MKGKNKSLIWMLLAVFTVALNVPLIAQDDLYYDPATDSKPVQTYEENYDEPSNVTRRYDGDDQNYYDEDDYAYEYSSRIRRFHRPARAIDYYDPFFVDLWYYDPFFLPGASIYTYGFNDYWTWRRWQRWQRWNAWNSWSFGWGWNNWGWNNWGWGGYGWNAWNNPFVWNNYYYDPYWTWNGCNPYYGNVWVNNNYYYNNGNNGGYRPQTYTGPRRHGTSVNPGYARLTNGNNPGRLVVADKGAPVIDMKNRPSGRVIEKETAQPAGRVSPSTTGRKPTDATANPTQAGRGQSNDKQLETNRPAAETRPSGEVAPDNDTRPSRRPSTQPAETRPSRNEETRPSRQPREETRPSRSNEETRPSRSRGSGVESRPSRSSGDRPSRSIESRPSRSNDSGGGGRIQSSPSRSSGGNSGSSSGSSRSGSSGGGSKAGGKSGGRGN